MSMGAAVRALPDRVFTISAGDRVVSVRAKTYRHALSSAQQRYGAAFTDDKIDSIMVTRAKVSTAPERRYPVCSGCGQEVVENGEQSSPWRHRGGTVVSNHPSTHFAWPQSPAERDQDKN